MLFVLLAGGALAVDTLAWFALQHRMGRRLDDLAAQAARHGWQFEASSRTRGGWPLMATMRVTAPSLVAQSATPSVEGPIDRGGFRWSAERATLSLSLLHPNSMILRIDGLQSLSSGSASAAMTLRLEGEPLIVSLPASMGRTRAISFATGRERGGFSLPGLAGGFRLEATRGTWRWTGQAQAVTISLRGIGGRDGSRAELSAASAFIEASVAASPLPAPSGLAADSPKGDRLLVAQAIVRWPDATLQASGQASLDGRTGAGPDGSFSLRITNGPALLARLVHSGQVTAPTGTAISAVLGLIAAGQDTSHHAGPREAGEQAGITLPITVEAGMVRLGEIPLLRLPAFDTTRTSDAAAMP